MRGSIASALLMSGLAAAQYSSNVSTSACPSPNGAHIITARASTEQEGYGIIGIVKDAILNRVPGSTAEFVVYPATLNNYVPSESDGEEAMRALITAYHSNCPNFPLVLLGYSQGAQVVTDSLVGQEDNGFPDNSTLDQPLSDSIFNQTAAVIVMGDPTLNLSEPFHVGTSNRSGIFPRQDISRFNATGLSSRIQSYCDYGDPYCAGGNELGVHLGYVGEYGAQAENFVVEKIRAWYGNDAIGTIVPISSTATATATASSGVRPMSTGAKTTGVKPTASAVSTGVSPSKPTNSATVTTPTVPGSTSTKNAAVASDATKVAGLALGGMFAWLLL